LCELEVPNVITPSIKDNLNDDFRIKGIEFFPNSTLQIFNRWGKKIFESTNYNDGNAWDGGNEAAGVYYYVLTVNYGDQNSCMEAKNYNGTITIVR
jgi:gliding motility-associated-like protein